MGEFRTHEYGRTYVAVEGNPVGLGTDTHYNGSLPDRLPAPFALNIAGGPDNLEFEDLGWFRPGSGPGRIVEERAEPALIAVHSSIDRGKWLATIWHPARLVFSNPHIPCIHSDPLPPDCPPGGRSRAVGLILFHEGDFASLLDRVRKEISSL